MQDKAFILAEIRKKAELECKKSVALYSWNVYLAVAFGLFIGLILAFGTMSFLFPINLIPLIVAPIIFYIGAKSAIRPYIFDARKVVEILENEPHDASEYVSRADILADYEFYEAAVEDYQTALSMEPDEEFDADLTWFSLANALQELDRDDEALEIVQKLSSTKGNYQDIALTLQGTLLAEKDPAKALKCFDKAIEIEPNNFNRAPL